MNISKEKIVQYTSKFKDSNVLIIGDVMLDSYMFGKVNRISPEAPIPVVAIDNKEFRLGGAGNVALNIKSLGANPILCSVIGDDNYSNILFELLDDLNMSNEGIIKEQERKTTVKTRVISGAQHILRVDEEDTFNLKNKTTKTLISKINDILNKYDISNIIFEDYDKGVISKLLIDEVKKSAAEKNIIISVDPKKKNFKNYKGVNLFKPNFKEFCEGLKLDIDKNSDIEMLAKESIKFINDNNINTLLITLSEKGVFICNKDKWKHFPAEIRNISDVSGAGDTVISVASLLMSKGANIETIAVAANLAGGLVCEKTGVVPINIEELISEFD